MFGFEAVSSLSHQLETLLDALRLGKVDATKSVTSVIFTALDKLKELSEDISRSGFDAPTLRNRVLRTPSQRRRRREEVPCSELDMDPPCRVLTKREHRLKENAKNKNTIMMVRAALTMS
jgi:two-component system chemotaxis sensor kinase CheA